MCRHSLRVWASESCFGRAWLGIAISRGHWRGSLVATLVLGRLGEMLVAGLAKMLRAEMTQHAADMLGCARLKATTHLLLIISPKEWLF